MNNDNNLNNAQNTTTPVVEPNQVPTTPVADKFVTVSDVNQINQTVEPVTSTIPVVTQPVETAPSTTPVVTQPVLPSAVETNPTTEVATAPQQNVDNNAMINENLQKVEIKNYTPPSKFKIFLLFVFFALLVVFIIFLPDISSKIRIYMSGNNEPQKEVITTGKLICTLSTNTSELDKEYEFEYNFTDSKLKTTKYVIYTRGDTTTESTLDELNKKCNILKEYTEEIDGVAVKCEYSEGKLMEKQVFELEKVKSEQLDAAYTEAGGLILSVKYDQEIDSIESNMKASGYTCERQR